MTFFSSRVSSARLWLWLGALVLVVEGVSALGRGAGGGSDLGVFLRTAVLLRGGASGELYAGHDAVTNWWRCIPPAGMMWFAPTAGLSFRAASVVWIVTNFLFAGVGAWALRAILRLVSPDEKSGAPFEILAGLLFLMGASSLQVGQYSLMFAVCWLLAVWAGLARRLDWAALVLALPAAIKLYPALLLLAPLCVLPPRRWPRFVLVFAASFALWTWGAPTLFYGARTPALESAFWHNIVLSPSGRLSESQSVSSTSNHGMDAVLLRFLADLPEPRGAPPHLRLAPKAVLKFVNPLRALVLLATLAFWLRRRTGRAGDARAWLLSLGLWSAALFVILPGAKSRYAVYAFAAFVPLVWQARALWAERANNRWPYTLFVVLIGALTLSLAPTTARLWGAGLWGALTLWLENGRLLRAPSPHRGEGAPH